MLHEENEEKERDGGVEERKKNLIPFSLQVVLIFFHPRSHQPTPLSTVGYSVVFNKALLRLTLMVC
jgi:hypothetical protein